MNLFKELGIKHSVLFDGDQNRKNQDYHQKVNKFLIDNKNEYTVKIDWFDDDIETFLNIPKESENYKNL